MYFSREFGYAANPRYCPADEDTEKRYMFKALVLTGHSTKGGIKMHYAPNREPNKPYDSLADDMDNPNLFVVFSDTQLYPEYLIEFV